ncbi:hypothetical protein TNIN_421241 [Trichonephila inaurata madagascariensis]|uniref:Uncharacterized protein n=1 Tax=Trichonephila inaurata madagascariensis TaxID=2747483 RepID=A0A8X6YSK8_9ARAC|nr:hypothetical protein TNIN_421241 [Trichonephila inaurata madagascariensis]
MPIQICSNIRMSILTVYQQFLNSWDHISSFSVCLLVLRNVFSANLFYPSNRQARIKPRGRPQAVVSPSSHFKVCQSLFLEVKLPHLEEFYLRYQSGHLRFKKFTKCAIQCTPN